MTGLKQQIKSKKNRKFDFFLFHIVRYGVPVLVAAYLCLCISMCLTERDTSFAEEKCMLYYIVNADGMKGLGHSILLLVDEKGCGTVFSFNGMQRSLGENLLGKSGIGKMSTGTMTADETATFLQSGDLCMDGDQLKDNYDIALYRPITTQDYDMILEQTAPYFMAEQEFAVLYEKWIMEENDSRKAEYKQALELMGQGEDLPVYQIYTNNCDNVARMLTSSIDPYMQEYLYHAWRITPNGNIKAFGKKAEKWGVKILGKQSLQEKILMFLMSF